MPEQVEGEKLFTIRKDLAAIRGCLLRSGPGDPREIAVRLRSVVDQFQSWADQGPVEKESVLEIQRELAEMQPLFENAYSLHSGWFALVDPAVAQYDGSGQRVGTAGHLVQQGMRG